MDLVYIKDDKRCYMNYKDLIFWIKTCYCKHFFSNQLRLPGGEKSFGGNIQLPSEVLVVEVDLNIDQNEEVHSENNIYAYVCQY